MEDSLIMKQEAVERGLFNVSKFTHIRSTTEQKEEIGIPDVTKTSGIKSGNYSKLVNGIIPKGVFLGNEDVVIGKYMTIGNKDKSDSNIYSDRSVVMRKRNNEIAVVRHVTTGINESGKPFVRVEIRKLRAVGKGDKFSSRAGQKGVCALLMKERDMPFSERFSPTMLFNPHGMPSRMTVSQWFEILAGKVCALNGTHMDATAFRPMDIESMADELQKLGYHRYGYERLYSGLTGEYIDSLIYMGPIFYQRLQKFVTDTEYSVNRATVDPITMQPREGQGNAGGLKIGEMEHDCIGAHGSTLFWMEKFFSHSDEYFEYRCTCGRPADVNFSQGIYKCSFCKDGAEIFKFATSYSAKLFRQEQAAVGIGSTLIPEPYIIEEYQ